MKSKAQKINIIDEIVPNIIEICVDNIGAGKNDSINKCMTQMDELQEQ